MQKRNWGLGIILAVTLFLRIPSLFEPYWYGDEAIYLTIGQAIYKGVRLYAQIYDNKPPLIYLVAAVVDGNLFWYKFVLLIWVLVTIWVFYKLAEKIFEKRLWVMISTAIFAFGTSWTKLEGNIGNAELFFLPFTVTTVWLLWEHKPDLKRIFLAGILLGLGGLFKVPAVLEAAIWPLVWIVFGDRDWWRKTLVFGSGVALPILASLGYFLANGSLDEYIKAVWIQNLPYILSWKATTEAAGIFSLKARAALMFILGAPILGLSKRIGKRGVIIGLWGLIALFAALLSGRPYPHYMLQALAALALCPGLLVTGKIWEKIIGGLLIILTAGVVVMFNFYNYATINYYANFISWVFKKESTQSYIGWFDPQVNNNYKIAELVKAGSLPQDKIFVWGDMPMLYALTKRSPVGKYTVKYHIKELNAENETMEMLISNPPKYIIDFGSHQDLPGLSGLLNDAYLLQKNVGQVMIWRLSPLDQAGN